MHGHISSDRRSFLRSVGKLGVKVFYFKLKWLFAALTVSLNPVSYTHLDVYKRQVYVPSEVCASPELFCEFTPTRVEAEVCPAAEDAAAPVSYTHL